MIKKVVDPKYAKSGEYKGVIETIARRGKCPFCPDNFRYHKNPILKKSNGWLITKNSWPYENSRHHFIIIAQRHMENLGELTTDDLRTVKELSDWTIAKFKIKGGALTIRFGNTTYTGATVCHLHFHLIVPKKRKTISFPVG